MSNQSRLWAAAAALVICCALGGCADSSSSGSNIVAQVGAQPPKTSPPKSPAPKPPTNPFRNPSKSSDRKAPDGKAPANPPAAEKTAPSKTGAAKVGDKTGTKSPGKAAPAAPVDDHPVRLPVFEGWAKPELAIVVTGRQNGYIEPCGCAGLTNQKGGMSRRHTMLKQLADRGWPLVPLDVGNQVKLYGRQSEIKFQVAFEGLKKMGYRAIGLGPDDLRLSSGELFSSISDEPQRFVCANVAVLDRDLTPRFLIVEEAGKKIGITAVLGDEYRRKLQSNEVIQEAAAAGLAIAAKELAAAQCDIQVLLMFAPLEDSRALAKRFPQFQLVVTAGGGEEPEFEPEVIAGTKNWLVQVGAKGMFAGVVGFFNDKQQPLRFQRVPLDDRYPDSQEMLDLLEAYQNQLQSAGLEGLELKPIVHPSGRTFVGSAACADCHSQADAVWQKTGHAHATDSLVKPRERSQVARHFDPECISCHVTGWEPQKHFPFKSGYLGLEATPELKQSGCENCHGPGSAHVTAEQGAGPAAAKQQARLEMRLPLAKAREKCLDCHDMDNSPAFHKDGAFEKYWKKVEHKGKD